VFHRVATISGTLDKGRTWCDLLRATLPGGSITGAPKIAACKLICQLEPTRRDVYCGAIGYIGLDGSMCLNVAIRTLQMSGRRLCLHAGGGIVADSDPNEEYEEIQAKAAGMLRALGW
jgi:para-aminobenzoate synthetase component 1